jgi:hypothetical protein
MGGHGPTAHAVGSARCRLGVAAVGGRGGRGAMRSPGGPGDKHRDAKFYPETRVNEIAANCSGCWSHIVRNSAGEVSFGSETAVPLTSRRGGRPVNLGVASGHLEISGRACLKSRRARAPSGSCPSGPAR